MRQKGESQNGCFKKTHHAKFFEKLTVLPSDTHTYVCISGGKKCLFFGKFGVLCFLETPVLRFALLPYYQWFASYVSSCHYQIFMNYHLLQFCYRNKIGTLKCHVKLELKKWVYRMFALQNVIIQVNIHEASKVFDSNASSYYISF